MVLKKTRIMQFTVVVGNIIQRKQGGQLSRFNSKGAFSQKNSHIHKTYGI